MRVIACIQEHDVAKKVLVQLDVGACVGVEGLPSASDVNGWAPRAW
jgi:hypothetical protein